jgi:ankyrin repeat protein
MSGLLVGCAAALRAGDLAKIQRLIGEGASIHDMNEFGENALNHAIINDHAPVVHWLLKEGGARMWFRYCTPLHALIIHPGLALKILYCLSSFCLTVIRVV